MKSISLLRIIYIIVNLIYSANHVNAAYLCSPNCYVSSSYGDDSNNGTFNYPWATISYAATQVLAGDTIWLFNGTWNANSVSFSNSGSISDYITIRAFNGTVILDGIDNTLNRDWVGISINGKSYINIQDIHITNYNLGILISSSSYINVQNVETYNNTGNLLNAYPGSIYVKTSHDCTIQNSNLHDDGGWDLGTGFYSNMLGVDSGLSSGTYNILIKNNSIHDTPGTSAIVPGLISHNLIDINIANSDQYWLRNITIDGNRLYGITSGYSHADAIYVHVNDASYQHPQRITIINNVINDTRGIQFVKGNDSVIQNNYMNHTYNGYQAQFTYSGNNVSMINNNVSNTTWYLFNGAGYVKDEQSPTYTIRATSVGSITVNYTDNGNFTVDGGSNVTSYITTDTSSHIIYRVGGYPRYSEEIYFPSSPINLANTTGNFWVNHTWQSGSGNVTNSYNVSQNSTWDNTSSNAYKNVSVGAHNWSNISVYAYNSSGNGSLNSTPISMNTQVPNNVIIITNTSNKTVTETETVYVDYDYTDLDSDTGTFSCNRTDLFTDFSISTGKGNWTTNSSSAGTYYIDFGVADGYDSVSNYTMEVMVNEQGGYDNRSLYAINASVNFGENCAVDYIVYRNLSTGIEYTYTCGQSGNASVIVNAGEAVFMNATQNISKIRTW